ncbi:MAG: hypothetical protein A2284_14860 [Deltaproteobacteria bacterium RIFOXYA12_FULL_61_11]|nr:MAG: hypothetical protein A2284_14860 [Deltaproteobacteria bacterium RIFOXYA12_FULL_61_11]
MVEPDEKITFTVEADLVGVRLDQALTARGGGCSRSVVQRRIEAGGATVDGRRERCSRRLELGEQVEAVWHVEALVERPAAELLPLEVLYEDDELAVVLKPAGLVVHPAKGHRGGTLVDALLQRFGGTLSSLGGAEKVGLVHRLDKDTSGLLLVARTDEAHLRLAALFQEHAIHKEYLALVHGKLRAEVGSIATSLARDPSDRTRYRVVTNGGREALSHYRRTKSWFGCIHLLNVRIETGRTHQIRVHLASIGCPVIGDATYSRPIAAYRELPVEVRQRLSGLPTYLLHAHRLGFQHPFLEQWLEFEAPLPPPFEELLAWLDSSA